MKIKAHKDKLKIAMYEEKITFFKELAKKCGINAVTLSHIVSKSHKKHGHINSANKILTLLPNHTFKDLFYFID